MGRTVRTADPGTGWIVAVLVLKYALQHQDFFTRNLLAILAEMRAAFGILDPQAFATVTAI